jgi:hypothetical protein
MFEPKPALKIVKFDSINVLLDFRVSFPIVIVFFTVYLFIARIRIYSALLLQW